jgi:cell pole-organizing protein PopZ
MGDARTDPSMEDILASIKRIIADDGAPVPATSHADGERAAEASTADDSILELTEPMAEVSPNLLVSPNAANASRQSLAALSKMIVRAGPEMDPPADNTLEALVRELLRPVLKEWLDAHLPELVEGLVAREIARITGKSF